jgi:hypothetical protein
MPHHTGDYNVYSYAMNNLNANLQIIANRFVNCTLAAVFTSALFESKSASASVCPL